MIANSVNEKLTFKDIVILIEKDKKINFYSNCGWVGFELFGLDADVRYKLISLKSYKMKSLIKTINISFICKNNNVLLNSIGHIISNNIEGKGKSTINIILNSKCINLFSFNFHKVIIS